jgi:hypothetical protein
MELWQMGEPLPTVTTFGPEVVDFGGSIVRRRLNRRRAPSV